jgi:hypothetical protein
MVVASVLEEDTFAHAPMQEEVVDVGSGGTAWDCGDGVSHTGLCDTDEEIEAQMVHDVVEPILGTCAGASEAT